MTAQGFNLTHNKPDAFSKTISKDSKRLERFKRALMFCHKIPGFATHYAIEISNWQAYEKAVAVDIGGSDGLVCIELAHKLPKLKLTVQGFPEVVAEGAKNILGDLFDRITFMPYDFFQVQPVKDADIYFPRRILHDGSDKYCLQILRDLISALKPGARILINEMCIPLLSS